MHRSQSQEIRRKEKMECPRTVKMGKTNSDLETEGETEVALRRAGKTRRDKEAR